MIRARGSNWLKKSLGSGHRALCPEPTLLCDISELIFANVFLFHLPANQEAGPKTPLAGGPKTRLAGRRSDSRDMEKTEAVTLTG